jgi:hypothetical protein
MYKPHFESLAKELQEKSLVKKSYLVELPGGKTLSLCVFYSD